MADGLAHWLHASQQKLMPLTLFGTTLLVWPQGGWCIPMRGPTTPSSPATASRMVTSAARYALDEGANRQRTSCPTTSSLQPKSRATGLESHGPTGVRVLGTLLRASAALVMMFPAVKTVLDTLPCITPSGTYNHPRTTPVRPTACCCGPCCFRPPPPVLLAGEKPKDGVRILRRRGVRHQEWARRLRLLQRCHRQLLGVLAGQVVLTRGQGSLPHRR